MKKLRFDSPLILGYAILSGIALLVNFLTGGWANVTLFSVYRCSFDLLAFVRLFGHIIGHVSLAHYAGNFMMILLLGPALERRCGWKLLLLFIAATAVVTGLLQMALFPSTMLLGASGIVFMMIVLTACDGLREGSIPITLLLVVVLYLGEQLVTGLTVKDTVSQLGHIIGGLCGLAFGIAFTRKKTSA